MTLTMSQSAVRSNEVQAILAAVIVIVLVESGYLDQHQWLIWVIIVALVAWLISGRSRGRAGQTSPLSS